MAIVQTSDLHQVATINLLSTTAFKRWMWLVQRVATLSFRVVSWFIPHRTAVQLLRGDLKPGARYVFAANHQSMMDAFIISSSLPETVWQQIRPLRFFTHNFFVDLPIVGKLLLALGCFPARQHAHYTYGLEAAMHFLTDGQSVFIFPQGRRMPDKGQARNGVAVLALDPRVMVIPVRIEWRKTSRWGRSYRLVIGRPLTEQGLSAQQILNRIYKLPVDAL